MMSGHADQSQPRHVLNTRTPSNHKDDGNHDKKKLLVQNFVMGICFPFFLLFVLSMMTDITVIRHNHRNRKLTVPSTSTTTAQVGVPSATSTATSTQVENLLKLSTPSSSSNVGGAPAREGNGIITTTTTATATATAAAAAAATTTPSEASSFSPLTSSNILFVIFCGGPSGYADMDAILDTWGKHVKHAIVMSNTPNDLPLERMKSINNNNTISSSSSWTVQYASSLEGGKLRQSKEFWNETINIIHEYLSTSPTSTNEIQWIVRSDSDTWWNVRKLQQQLLEKENTTATLLPSNEPLMMGQFFPLVDFDWIKGTSNDPKYIQRLRNGNTNHTTTTTDSGRTAYLSGGSGVVFTRTAMDTYKLCLDSLTKNNDDTNDTTPTQLFSVPSIREDLWLSKLAYECNVTLVHNNDMYQFGNRFHKSRRAEHALSIHHVVGDGRKNYKHPSFFENALLKQG